MGIKKRKYGNWKNKGRNSQKKKSYAKKEKSVEFSFVIPIHDAGNLIQGLLSKIIKYHAQYNIEIILIDSESTDNTIPIINSYQLYFPNIILIKIKRHDFNHGLTRNIGIKKSKGRYIIFLTRDVVLIPKVDYLEFIRKDFNIDKKIVAVTGKQIFDNNLNTISNIEQYSIFEQLDKISYPNPLIMSKKMQKLEPYKNNPFLLFYLSNVFTTYRRDYLKKNPFKKVSIGEDIVAGKEIIENNFLKIYDNRCVVRHMNNLSPLEYLKRQILEYSLKKNELNIPYVNYENGLTKYKNKWKNIFYYKVFAMNIAYLSAKLIAIAYIFLFNKRL